MPEREARTVLRRLAEGVASAHRVGLAVGGLTPETVVLRPNGLVGLRSVPAASGTVQGDVAALGELLEYCLTGMRPGAAPAGTSAGMPPDLAALVRRARSTEPGGGLSSVAAMAALLAERPRTGHTAEQRASDESDSGWLRRLRERRQEERAEGPGTHVAVDPAPTRDASGTAFPPPHGRSLPPVPGRQYEDDEDDLLPLSGGAHRGDDDLGAGAERPGDEGGRAGRRRLLLVGLPLAALAVVVALAVYLGNNVISVSDEITVDQAPVPSAPSTGPAPTEPTPAPADVPPATITGGSVYDPFGDGDPDNPDEVPLSFDGDPSTAWSTVTYRGSPEFGNLKDGIGIVYDLGSEQALAGIGVTGTVGTAVQVRVGDQPEGDLESYEVVGEGALGLGADLSFDEPVTTRYVLLWVTRLAPSDRGFSAEVAEVTLTPAS